MLQLLSGQGPIPPVECLTDADGSLPSRRMNLRREPNKRIRAVRYRRGMCPVTPGNGPATRQRKGCSRSAENELASSGSHWADATRVVALAAKSPVSTSPAPVHPAGDTPRPAG